MLIVTSTVYGKREPMNTNNVENYNERYSPERETYVIKKDGSLEKRNRSVNASFLI